MNNLKKYRDEMGLTQAQVADYLGIARETYNALENGKSMPSLLVADALASLYRVTVYDLWELDSQDGYDTALAARYFDGKDAAMDAIMHAASVLC